MVALLALIQPGFAMAQAGAGKTTARPAERTAAASSDKKGPGIQPVHLSSRFVTGTQTPDFSWVLKAGEDLSGATMRDVIQSAYQVRLSQADGSPAAAPVWDSGKVASRSMDVAYTGPEVTSHTQYAWQVRVWGGGGPERDDRASPWSSPAGLTTTLRGSDWKAQWIGFPEAGPAPANAPLPIFRRAFPVGAHPTRALLFISGLGQYSALMNGQEVTDALLTPGWTDYRKRIFFNTYDVTALLSANKANALAVLLGNGMYNVEKTAGRYAKFTGTFGPPKVIAQLEIRFSDGSTQTIATDASWKIAPGPVTFSSTYGGEDFDARLVQTGWDAAAFKDDAWPAASVVPSPGGVLIAQPTPPIRRVDTFQPVKTVHPSPNITIYDLGQNFVGWPAITVTGPAGATIRLLCGELLDGNGNVTQRSANAFPKAPNLYTYTLRGGSAPESWHPLFGSWGFRYVQAAVSSPDVRILSLEGHSMHTDSPVVGHFSATGPQTGELFNRIHTLIDNAILSNMASVFTDCPHREKLGWIEQTQLMASSIMANYDVSAMYRKMQDDIVDDQHPDGNVPTLVPDYTHFKGDFGDTPEWGSAVILSPWAAYQAYGHLDDLGTHYESMKRYAAYLGARAGRDGNKAHLLSYGLGDWYDIGPGDPGRSKLTGPIVTPTVTFYQDLMALAEIASLLHRPEDSAAFAREAAEVRDAFNEALFHADTNLYDRGSQTALAMPLAVGIVPPEHRQAVLDNLVADIRAHQNHVTSGEIGFHYVVRALTEGKRSDVLFDMLSRTDSPSYGYQLSRGATTLTEAWDTNPTSSQNHFMLGHAEEWFSRGLAGLNVDLARPAGRQILIQPTLVGDISTATASLDSPLGHVETTWKRTPERLSLEVIVPPNASAFVILPPSYPNNLAEAGVPLLKRQVPGIHSIDARTGTLVLGSGIYHFTSTP